MTGVLGLCLAATLGPLFLILSYLLIQGAGSLNWSFFTELPIDGGMLSPLVGSLQLVGLAVLIAVPLGLMASIYLAEYRDSFFSSAVRFVGELMMGVPSIVVGIFAAAVIDGPLRWHGLAGSFALGRSAAGMAADDEATPPAGLAGVARKRRSANSAAHTGQRSKRSTPATGSANT